jgi:hypothetical protein
MVKWKASIALAILFAAPASAQQWDWSVSPYLWASAIDGTVVTGPLESDVSVSFSDIVDILRGAALVRLEGQNAKHGVFGDLVYLRLKETNARDTIGGSLELKLDSLIVEGAYFRRLSETFALELGARYWDLETTLRPAILPAVTTRADFVDAFVGIRSEFEISEKWELLFRGNVGGGGSDFAAGMQIDFRRSFASGNSLDIGYRALDIDYEDGEGLSAMGLDLSLHGLAIGYTFDL